MDDKTHEAVFLQNQVHLNLPQANATLIENMEQRVILDCGHRQFKNISDEVRHYRAAAATLRIYRSNVRHGHVEGKIQGIVPLRPAIKYSGSEPDGAILLCVAIDDGCPA